MVLWLKVKRNITEKRKGYVVPFNYLFWDFMSTKMHALLSRNLGRMKFKQKSSNWFLTVAKKVLGGYNTATVIKIREFTLISLARKIFLS